MFKSKTKTRKTPEEWFEGLPKYRRDGILKELQETESLNPQEGEQVINATGDKSVNDINASTVTGAASAVENIFHQTVAGQDTPYLVQVVTLKPQKHGVTGEEFNFILGILDSEGKQTFVPIDLGTGTNPELTKEVAAETYKRFAMQSKPGQVSLPETGDGVTTADLEEDGLSTHAVVKQVHQANLAKVPLVFPKSVHVKNAPTHYVNLAKFHKDSYQARAGQSYDTPPKKKVKIAGAAAVASTLAQAGLGVLGQVAGDLLAGIF